MRNHDLILERSFVRIRPEEYEQIHVGDWIDVLSPRGSSVDLCVRVASIFPLAGQTRFMRSQNQAPVDLEEYLKADRLALCPLYGKALARRLGRIV